MQLLVEVQATSLQSRVECCIPITKKMFIILYYSNYIIYLKIEGWPGNLLNDILNLP